MKTQMEIKKGNLNLGPFLPIGPNTPFRPSLHQVSTGGHCVLAPYSACTHLCDVQVGPARQTHLPHEIRRWVVATALDPHSWPRAFVTIQSMSLGYKTMPL
jgi:hypothetical protein